MATKQVMPNKNPEVFTDEWFAARMAEADALAASDEPMSSAHAEAFRLKKAAYRAMGYDDAEINGRPSSGSMSPRFGR